MRKSNISKYWSKSNNQETPFFGKYLSKNSFQLLLANFHINDNTKEVRRGRPGHDPLFKVRPLVNLLSERFKLIYRPNQFLSFDESSMPWKGRLFFRCYNPRKPAKFHIKFFSVCEAESGYVLGFDIYCGKKNDFSAENQAEVLDPECTKTTKVVMGLMASTGLLDSGYFLFMANFYSSPELYEELHYRSTFAAGTVRKSRKGLPKSCGQANLKLNESVWRRKGPLLALKWCQKRAVYMISTIHSAVLVETKKVDSENRKIWKPKCVVDYVKKMGGIDRGDQLLTYNNFLRKTVKWSLKLNLHLINLCLVNAWIIFRKFANERIGHDDFRGKIVDSLLKEGLPEANLKPPAIASSRLEKVCRLDERHFPSFIPAGIGGKRNRPCRECYVCRSLPRVGGDRRVRKRYSSYWCAECQKVLCVNFCFMVYHTKEDYKTSALDHWLNYENIM